MKFIEDAIQSETETVKYCTEGIGRLARLGGWLESQPAAAELSDLIRSVSIYSGGSLFIHLTDEARTSHAPAKFALLFGELKKAPSYDGRSIDLTKTFEVGHPSGLGSVSINYMPADCRLVEERIPLSEAYKAQIEDELANGRIKFRTECGPEAATAAGE